MKAFLGFVFLLIMFQFGKALEAEFIVGAKVDSIGKEFTASCNVSGLDPTWTPFYVTFYFQPVSNNKTYELVSWVSSDCKF